MPSKEAIEAKLSAKGRYTRQDSKEIHMNQITEEAARDRDQAYDEANAEPLRQLNLNDKRVAAWYDACARHSDRCKNGDCKGCERLMARNRELRAIPGLLA